jgi:pyruvate,water dikinase
MSEKEDQIDFVKWFSELDKDSIKFAGGKGANLGEMYNLKIPVPPGFVVTAQAYDYFIEKAKVKEKITKLLNKIEYNNTTQLDEITKEIRELIVNSKMPKDLEEEIIESYENLDSDNSSSLNDFLKRKPEDLFVAVRSSATAEDLADASFAGQQDTYLNIKGKEALLENIKKCFASLFTSRATYYRNKKGFKHEETSLAVVVQKMVDSDKSGVMFSTDPTYKDDNIIIEAVYGLGEGIVSGMITPDKYILSKEGFKLLDKKIANKKIALTRNSGGDKLEVKLTDERSNAQVLKENELRGLSEIAVNLENHYQKPQDIEFAIENGEIFIVQTRAITTSQNKIEASTQKIEGEEVLSGLAASPGIGAGKVKIVKEMSDLNKVNEGDVLVTKMTNPDMVVTMQKASAIVTDEGGLTAHAAIVSREMGIPCIVGTQDATTKLKEGEIITVDGFHGKVYKGKHGESKKKEILPVTAKTKTKIKVIVDLPTFAERASKSGLKEVGLTRLEGIIAESGKHPNYFLEKKEFKDYEDVIFKGVNEIAKYFEKLWVRTSDIRSDEFGNLEGAPKEKEANPMLGMHGIRYSIKYPELLKAELNALKRVSERGKEIGILMPQIISVSEVKKAKEILKEIGFTKAKLGVMVETPAAVQIIKDLCDEGIDFISFGTNDLTQYILAVDRGNEQVQHLYEETHPAVLYQIEFVIRVCKRKNVETSICGQSGSRKEMVKFLVERGIDSISVNADVAKEISDYVAELEEHPKKVTIAKSVEEVEEVVEKKESEKPSEEKKDEIVEESSEEEKNEFEEKLEESDEAAEKIEVENYPEGDVEKISSEEHPEENTEEEKDFPTSLNENELMDPRELQTSEVTEGEEKQEEIAKEEDTKEENNSEDVGEETKHKHEENIEEVVEEAKHQSEGSKRELDIF